MIGPSPSQATTGVTQQIPETEFSGSDPDRSLGLLPQTRVVFHMYGKMKPDETKAFYGLCESIDTPDFTPITPHLPHCSADSG